MCLFLGVGTFLSSTNWSVNVWYIYVTPILPFLSSWKIPVCNLTFSPHHIVVELVWVWFMWHSSFKRTANLDSPFPLKLLDSIPFSSPFFTLLKLMGKSPFIKSLWSVCWLLAHKCGFDIAVSCSLLYVKHIDKSFNQDWNLANKSLRNTA